MASASVDTAIIICIRAPLQDELQDIYTMAQEDDNGTHDSARDGGSGSPSQLEQMLPRSGQGMPSPKLLPSSLRGGCQTVGTSAVSPQAGGSASAMLPNTKASFVSCQSIAPAKPFLAILAAVQGLLQGGLQGGFTGSLSWHPACNCRVHSTSNALVHLGVLDGDLFMVAGRDQLRCRVT